MHASKLASREDREGFSLIELLVVIAILGVLFALVMSGIQSSRAAAHRVKCANNLKQIGAAIVMYADTRGGRMPESTHTTGVDERKAWIYTLKPYLDNVDVVRICPVDPQGKERLAEGGTSYVMNEYLVVPGKDSCTNLYKLQSSTKTITVFTASDNMSPSSYSDHTHSYQWFSKTKGFWGRVLADIQPDRHVNGNPAKDHTNGGANYLYADGHVDFIQATAIKAMVDRNENFAKPPK